MAGDDDTKDDDKEEKEEPEEKPQGDEPKQGDDDSPELLAALDRRLHGSLDRYFAKFDKESDDTGKPGQPAAAGRAAGPARGNGADTPPKAKQARPEAKGEGAEVFDPIGFLFGKR